MSNTRQFAAGVFAASALLFSASGLMHGCGFPAALSRTHEGLKAMSREVEPHLAAECLRRAKACKAAGAKSVDDCPELQQCRYWKSIYAHSVQQIHKGLATCSMVHDEAKRAGVLK